MTPGSTCADPAHRDSRRPPCRVCGLLNSCCDMHYNMSIVQVQVHNMQNCYTIVNLLSYGENRSEAIWCVETG